MIFLNPLERKEPKLLVIGDSQERKVKENFRKFQDSENNGRDKWFV